MKEQHSYRLRKIGACLFTPTLKSKEREFVVDSGASMHMISKKDLSEAEMDTLTKSCSPTIVITANGEVQTQEEAIVCVKELGRFWTMKVLENTPAVLSFGKLCDENGYSTNGSMVKNHISLKTEFGLSATRRTSFLSGFLADIFIVLTDTFETGESFFFFIFFFFAFFTYSRRNSGSRKRRCD